MDELQRLADIYTQTLQAGMFGFAVLTLMIAGVLGFFHLRSQAAESKRNDEFQSKQVDLTGTALEDARAMRGTIDRNTEAIKLIEKVVADINAQKGKHTEALALNTAAVNEQTVHIKNLRTDVNAWPAAVRSSLELFGKRFDSLVKTIEEHTGKNNADHKQVLSLLEKSLDEIKAMIHALQEQIEKEETGEVEAVNNGE